MAKSIRKVSSQPTAPALHAILLSKGRENADILQYFNAKRRQGSSAVPLAVISKPVIEELRKVLRESAQKKVGVQIATLCIDEFASNYEVREPWSEFCEEISQLLFECLCFISDARKHDSVYKTSTFQDSLKLLPKLCNGLTCLSSKNSTLSSALFNKCAEVLLCLVLLKEVNQTQQDLILTALSSLCREADQQNISVTFKRVALYLKYVAKMVLDMSVDTQMSIYTILVKSVSSKEEATRKAQIWFIKWPALQEAFVECYTKNYAQGCGMFLDILFEVRTKSNVRQVNQKIVPMSTPSQNSKSQCASQTLPKTAGSTTSITAGSSTGKGTNIATLQRGNVNVCEEKTPQFAKPTVNWKSNEGIHSKHSLLKTRLQTPYHPNHHKSSSLHQQTGTSASQSSVSITSAKPDQSQGKQSQRTNQYVKTEPYQQRHSSNLTQQDDHSVKAESVKYNISPKNHQFSSRRDSDGTVLVQENRPENPQSPLSVLGEEDSSSKIERWFSGFSTANSSNHGKKSTKSSNDGHSTDEIKESSRKRPAPTPATQSKKRRVEAAPTPAWKPEKPSQPGCSNAKVQFEIPSVKLKKNTARQDERAPSIVDTNITPGDKKGRRMLYSKSRDSEYIGNNFLEERPSPEPFQEPIPKTENRPSKHWEKKLLDLKSSQVKDSQIYNFGKTESSEKSFKIPKPPPKKRAAKTPKIPTRFACLLSNPQNKENDPPKEISTRAGAKKAKEYPKNEENDPPKEISTRAGAKKAKDYPILKPAKEAAPLMTPLKDVTNRPSNNLGTNSTVKSMLSSKRHRHWSSPNASPEIESKSEEKQIPTQYSPIQDDSIEIEPEPLDTGIHHPPILPPARPANNLKNESMKPSAPVPQFFGVQSPLQARIGKPLATVNNQTGITMKTNDATGSLERQSGTKPKVGPRNGTSADSSLEAPGTSRRNNRRECDSGIDTSDVFSVSSKEAKPIAGRKESANSQYLRMRLRDYLGRAKDANTDMTENQNTVSTELVEIKGLVEKLSASVGRCQTASTSNETKLRQQKSSLEGCSTYLGPYEDQTFPAKVHATKYMDYKEFARQIRARNAERMRQMLQTVIDQNLPLSPPDSSDSE